MVHTIDVKRSKAPSTRRVLGVLGACGVALAVAGCESDSFLDPSITGRWEWTPTSVPILERISAIEDAPADLVEYSDVTPNDLIPDPSEYRIGPGDHLQIILYDDIDNRGVPSLYERDVDIRGSIDLPQLGQINLTNRTVEQAKAAIGKVLSRFVNEPLVSVVVLQQRQQTFNVLGAVETPGPYFISKPDYRLLEALTAAGRFSEASTDEVYIIRQIPLSDAVKGMVPIPEAPATAEPSANTPAAVPAPGAQPPPDGGKLIDLVDQLSTPAKKPDQPAPQPAEKPVDAPKQPPAVDPKRPAFGVMGRPDAPAPSRRLATRPVHAGQPPVEVPPPATQPKTDERPPVELLDQPETKRSGPDASKPPSTGGSWVFIHGEWVQTKPQAPIPSPSAPSSSGALQADQLMTQRVIRVPVRPLVAGLAQYNIVIRPGDIIHVPPLIEGFVYMAGQVQRPGPYTLPGAGKMTLIRAVTAAGGLSSIAIPERVDLTRVVGHNRQATIRLDYRAISEGTMPDIYMRPDDIVNVGTNFWAYPLAVLRNGIRTSYGFGFVVDRNFDNEIFGQYQTFGTN